MASALPVLSLKPSGEPWNILLAAHGNTVVDTKADFRAAAS